MVYVRLESVVDELELEEVVLEEVVLLFDVFVVEEEDPFDVEVFDAFDVDPVDFDVFVVFGFATGFGCGFKFGCTLSMNPGILSAFSEEILINNSCPSWSISESSKM